VVLYAATLQARTAGGAPLQREAMTMQLIVQHTVRDYDAWKAVFDEHEPERARFGCKGHTLYRDTDDPNNVTLFLRYESRERADAFMKDPSLREAMEKGGVISEPRTTWVHEEESCEYAARRAA
jgi:quinol monooxygenase YgiN